MKNLWKPGSLTVLLLAFSMQAPAKDMTISLTSDIEKRPTITALKDPLSGNLDRIQIIKGWLDADTRMYEKVYDVAWGDAAKRQPGKDGKLPLVGDTVDVANATWTDTIGDPGLAAFWTDPDFDPSQRAFYYARVVEIPTPRWTAYDQKRFGIKMSDEVPMKHQERAWTSPIWYKPAVGSL